MGKNWLWLVGTCRGAGLDIVPPMEVNCGQTFDTAVGTGALYWPFSRSREVNRGHFQANGGYLWVEIGLVMGSGASH